MLRQFLYLDHDLVREFLAQAEGGVYDESREVTKSEGKRGATLGITAGPARAGVEGAKSSQAESEAVIRQTAASEFERLYTELEAQGLAVYDVIDVPLDSLPIKRKEFIEVDAHLRVSGLERMVDLMGLLPTVVPLMEAMGASDDLDADTISAVRAVSSLNDADRPLPVIATVPGDTRVRLALNLRRTWLRTESIDSDASVVLKVQRVLRPGETIVVGDMFGGLMNLLPDEQKQQLVKSLESDDLAAIGIGESQISYPGLVGTPVAIYR